MTPKDEHNLEQTLASIAETFPPMWKRMYDNLLKEGFTELDALKLVATHVNASCGGRFTV